MIDSAQVEANSLTAGDEWNYSSRLNFLYKAVDDTQSTIRFLDTKAAFCVTLLSAMVAGATQSSAYNHLSVHRASFIGFLGFVVLSLLCSLRVIFPVIKPHTEPLEIADRTLPKYFVHQHRDHHWLRHTFRNSVNDVLAEDLASYIETMSSATDADLMLSMCDELMMISLVRQIPVTLCFVAVMLG
jgi:hypothetical protein